MPGEYMGKLAFVDLTTNRSRGTLSDSMAASSSRYVWGAGAVRTTAQKIDPWPEQHPRAGAGRSPAPRPHRRPLHGLLQSPLTGGWGDANAAAISAAS